jgi:predicted kinase
MQELILCRGIPASGKSTYAMAWVLAAPGRVRVNRDDIRFQTYGVYHGGNVNEDVVTKIEDAMIAAALSAGMSVIVDDTNIRHAYVKRLAKIGHAAGVPVSVKQFDIDVSTAVRRNNLRDRQVPDDVIREMHARLKSSGPVDVSAPVYETYVAPPMGDRAVMFDIDGTLAQMSGRSPYEWHRVGEDTVVPAVATTLRNLAVFNTIIIMSGRDSVCRPETEDWLRRHDITYDELFMRAEKDMRPDNIIKYELFNKHIRDDYDILAVYDDRDQVVNMWRAIGLPCFQVAPGAF